MLYAMEYTRVKKVLDKPTFQFITLTPNTQRRVGQLKTRVEAFLEMLNARVDF
jgi:benzoyl-CoA reductase/2-hydroxyglutaryl-CoA dehydratase subunit BcrC/BadD/HgdB